MAAESTTLGRLFRSRDFRLLWIGTTISLTGDGVLLVALAWQVLALSRSPSALALVAAAMALPQALFAVFGGVVSDRFDRRHVMIGADAVRATALSIAAVLASTGALAVWHLALIGAIYGAASAFFLPAFDAIVPDLVPADQLVQANAADQLVRPVAVRIAGPMLGGALVAVGRPGFAFALDALSFVVSIACLRRIGTLIHPDHPTNATTPITSIRECARFVRGRVWLWGTLVSSAIACFLFLGPSEILLPFVVKQELHASPATYAVILAFGGLGTVVAALSIGRRGLPRREITFIYAAWTISTLAVAGYGLATTSWHLMVACCVFNLFEGAGLIAWASLRQRLVPRDLLGRVASLDWALATALLPLSLALAGPVAAVLGARTTLFAAGTLASAVTAGAYFLPGMRNPDTTEFSEAEEVQEARA